MKSRGYKVIVGTAALALMLLASVMIPFGAMPVAAHSPSGAADAPEVTLGPIQMYDQNGELREISLDEVGEELGGTCICVATAYQVTKAAIAELWGDEIPAQGDLKVVYRHPGNGHRTTFELLLTPECAVYEKTGDPKHLTMDNWTYTCTRLSTGDEITLHVNEDVIAAGFFDMRYTVNGFKKGWHEVKPTEAQKAEFAALWSETRDNMMTLPAWEIFAEVTEPEEAAPVAAIAFSTVLLAAIGVGLVLSARGKRKVG